MEKFLFKPFRHGNFSHKEFSNDVKKEACGITDLKMISDRENEKMVSFGSLPELVVCNATV